MKNILWTAVVLCVIVGCNRDGDAPDEHAEGATEEAHQDTGRVVLSEAAIKTAEILVEAARSDIAANAGAGLEVPGEVRFDQRRVAIISPRVDGRLEQLSAVEGDRVRAGATVAQLFTPSFVSAQADYLLARRRATALAGTQDAAGAAALVEASMRRLRVLGASSFVIQQLASSGQIRETLPIQAPFNGSIVEVSALPGAAVSAGTPIFKIADLSYVDVAAAIPERALSLVRVGLKANVRLAAYPGVQFDGEVERMDQELDEATRTVNAIIHVQNRSGSLMPGMFATVRLQTPGAAATNVGTSIVTIPESALVNEGEQRYVFVEIKHGTYERRLVEVASLEAPGASQPLTNRVVVRHGLAAGERVVVRGAFTLKSELGKSAFGDGH